MTPKRITPGPRQESVWDYPRPPALVPCAKRIRVIFDRITIADSRSTYRVLETSHPPVYYIPPSDIRMEYLREDNGESWCEWKGRGRYYGLIKGEKESPQVAWYYRNPTERFAAIKDYIAFYAGRVDACFVDDEEVTPQPGDFYGGWITSDIVGPFKGSPGSMGW